MSREKQIEEMAKTIYEQGLSYDTFYQTHCESLATDLYNAGYRRSFDLAEEIFAEIEHTARAAIILLKFEKEEKLRNTKTECYEDLLGYIAELKKKYIGKDTNVPTNTEEGK